MQISRVLIISENYPKILIIDDEESIRKFLRVTLTTQEYVVIEAFNGQDGLSLAVNHKPDIIILDLGLPDIDGVEVTHLLRQWSETPIIILSVRGSEDDKIAALDTGVDDYFTKPFSAGEFLARLRADLRRKSHLPSENIFTVSTLKVDLAGRIVTISGQEVQLTPIEYDLLKIFITHSGRVLTHRQLLREVWGKMYEEEFHILHVNISNLRRKIESDPARPRLIITEPGVGCRLMIRFFFHK